MHFEEEENGEKVLVFKSEIRKKYMHQLENNEKFITEARMYYKMDEEGDLLCFNETIMLGEYQQDGYTNNIRKQFLNSPYGYYCFFKEILQKDLKKATFKKRLYAIKHYILFSYLTKQYNIKTIKNWENKILYILLLVPGIIKSIKFKKEEMVHK